MHDEQKLQDRESRIRSLLKAVTYRITGTLLTAGLVYVITGELDLALTVGVIEPALKIVVYYLHERAWAMVPRGTFRRLAGAGGNQLSRK